ncbi:MAG: hypothetical protein Q8K98_02840 [Bacteroidota bacterium]|nr:hypothetical protein [Bacteroidota bacterium]
MLTVFDLIQTKAESWIVQEMGNNQSVIGGLVKYVREQKYPEWHTPVEIARDRIFGIPTIPRYLLRFDAPTSTWERRLRNLFSNNPDIPLQVMGFPDNWEESVIWQ